MLQHPSLGTHTRVVVTAVVTSLIGGLAVVLAENLFDGDALALTVGLVAGALVAGLVVLAMRSWTQAPVRALADQRWAERSGPSGNETAPEAIVQELVKELNALESARDVSQQSQERTKSDVAEGFARERERSDELMRRLEEQRGRQEQSARVNALHHLTLDPILDQLGRAIERVISIDAQPAAARPLLRVARAATIWAEEAVDILKHIGEPASPSREPFSLRDEVGTLARAIALGMNREVSTRFDADLPAQVMCDRGRLRLATLSIAQWLATRDPDCELVLHAAFNNGTELEPAKRSYVIITLDSRPQRTGPLAPAVGPLDGDIAAFDALVAPSGGRIMVGPDRHRLGFQLEATRQKRSTGTTLYGVGALSERSVLVIDARPRGRASLCEQLAAWRMTPTAVSDVTAALEAFEAAERVNKPFDCVIVCPRIPGMRSDGTPPELTELARHPTFRGRKILSLEAFDTLTASLPKQVLALDPQRMARPMPPLELLEALTLTLAPKPMPRMALHGGTRGHGGLSVLVIEDNAVNQALLQKMLERRGHHVVVTANGADGVDRLDVAPKEFDVVLMDIQMPVMDGYEATTVIRMREAQGGLARVPIIAVTAHAMSGEREKCLDAGMDGYLSKPVSESELMATIDDTMNRVREHDLRPYDVDYASVPPASDVFDARRVLEFAAGDQAFLRTLVDIFGDTTPKQVQALAQAIQSQDANALLRAAHQLKGSVGNFAAERARKLAAELEDHGRRKNFDAAQVALGQLQLELDELNAALQGLVATT